MDPVGRLTSLLFKLFIYQKEPPQYLRRVKALDPLHQPNPRIFWPPEIPAAHYQEIREKKNLQSRGAPSYFRPYTNIWDWLTEHHNSICESLNRTEMYDALAHPLYKEVFFVYSNGTSRQRKLGFGYQVQFPQHFGSFTM